MTAASEQAGSRKKIEVEDLTIRYGGFVALRNLDLDVYSGEILGIIGPAKSGKSTFLKALNRTIDPVPGASTAGRTRVDGQDISALKDVHALRRRIGMVFPLPVGLPMSIYDNVAYAPRMAGLDDRTSLDETVERCLRRAAPWEEVKDRLRGKATDLILEQQQELCIARLLPLKPRVILMDEPCSALDIEGTRAIEDMMLSLREKYTIVIVTHNMAQARRVSDECIFVLLGELIEHGTSEDLFLKPRDARTADYIEGRYG